MCFHLAYLLFSIDFIFSGCFSASAKLKESPASFFECSWSMWFYWVCWSGSIKWGSKFKDGCSIELSFGSKWWSKSDCFSWSLLRWNSSSDLFRRKRFIASSPSTKSLDILRINGLEGMKGEWGRSWCSRLGLIIGASISGIDFKGSGGTFDFES